MISDILNILSKLNKSKGIKGSLLMTDDGIIIGSLFNKNQKDKAYAAFSSAITLTIKNNLELFKSGLFNRYSILFEDAILFIVNLEASILLVMADKSIKKAELNIAIFEYSSIIKRLGRIEGEKLINYKL